MLYMSTFFYRLLNTISARSGFKIIYAPNKTNPSTHLFSYLFCIKSVIPNPSAALNNKESCNISVWSRPKNKTLKFIENVWRLRTLILIVLFKYVFYCFLETLRDISKVMVTNSLLKVNLSMCSYIQLGFFLFGCLLKYVKSTANDTII